MIALLLRFFPARWRARYGEEFEALLAERPLGPFDVADILLAALDAHLHRHGLGAVPHPTGGFTMSLRIGGYAAIAGGGLWLLGMLYGAGLAAAGADGTGLTIFLIFVGNLLLLAALAGLSAFQARRFPRLTWAAFVVPAVGAVAAIVGLLAMQALGDRPFVGGVSAWYVWLFGTLALVVGSSIFALVTWRTGDLPRLPLAPLIVALVGLVPFVIDVANGEASEPILGIAVVVCLISFAAGWVAVGWSALRLDRAITPTGSPA
jgi:hypothetical protein